MRHTATSHGNLWSAVSKITKTISQTLSTPRQKTRNLRKRRVSNLKTQSPSLASDGLAVALAVRHRDFSTREYANDSIAVAYCGQCRAGGMEVSEAKRLKALEDENARLKTLSPNGCWMQRTPRASRKKCMVRQTARVSNLRSCYLGPRFRDGLLYLASDNQYNRLSGDEGPTDMGGGDFDKPVHNVRF